MSKVSEFHSDSSKLECEVMSTRTFGNNKAERFKDKYDSVYLHRSCLRDGCYTTNVKVNNDRCYCVSGSCNRGETFFPNSQCRCTDILIGIRGCSPAPCILEFQIEKSVHASLANNYFLTSCVFYDKFRLV